MSISIRGETIHCISRYIVEQSSRCVSWYRKIDEDMYSFCIIYSWGSCPDIYSKVAYIIYASYCNRIVGPVLWQYRIVSPLISMCPLYPPTSRIILGMASANGWCYYVTTSLIGLTHTQNDPWTSTNFLKPMSTKFPNIISNMSKMARKYCAGFQNSLYQIINSPRNFLGGLVKLPASGWMTQRSSTNLEEIQLSINYWL